MTRRFAGKLARMLLNLVLVVLLGGLAAAALVRYSPGFDLDENAWTPKMSAATLAARHARYGVESGLPVFYARYLAAAVRGDFGISQSFDTPVAELLARRIPISAKLIAWGTCGGLLCGGLLAWLAVWPRHTGWTVITASISGFLIAIPPAVLALFFFFSEAPLAMAISLAIVPRVFVTMKALLAELHASTALLGARARGVGSVVIGVQYVLRPAMQHLLALTGVALVLGLGCIIPVEALCDVPGIGQLAWKAALARDLPLLSALALVITFTVTAVHSVSELVA